jgi:hypothetical protein
MNTPFEINPLQSDPGPILSISEQPMRVRLGKTTQLVQLMV